MNILTGLCRWCRVLTSGTVPPLTTRTKNGESGRPRYWPARSYLRLNHRAAIDDYTQTTYGVNGDDGICSWLDAPSHRVIGALLPNHEIGGTSQHVWVMHGASMHI